MIHYLEHKEIDRKRWDDCIDNSPNAIIYASSWYLDIVAPKQWDALVFGEYEAVFPLTWNKKLGIYYLYQPFFTQQLGAFGRNAAKLITDFIHAIPARFLKVEINLNTQNPVEPGEGFHILTAKTHHLLLDVNHEKLFAGYADNSKRNIKKAQKVHPHMATNVPAEKAVKLFRDTVGRKTPEIKERHYVMLQKLLEESRKRKQLYCNGLEDESGRLVTCMAFLQNRGSLIYLIGAATDESRGQGCMHLLMDDCIRTYAESGLLLDFEGSEIPGIARFFKGFGSREVNYYRLRMNRLPVILRLLKK